MAVTQSYGPPAPVAVPAARFLSFQLQNDLGQKTEAKATIGDAANYPSLLSPSPLALRAVNWGATATAFVKR